MVLSIGAGARVRGWRGQVGIMKHWNLIVHRTQREKTMYASHPKQKKNSGKRLHKGYTIIST